MSSHIRCLALASAMLAGVSASAAPAPVQRGVVDPPPATTARAVVTLCGLAVVLVEDSEGSTATLYAGPAIDQRLGAAGAGTDEFELADVYTPVAEVCDVIRAEHERILRSREARR